MSWGVFVRLTLASFLLSACARSNSGTIINKVSDDASVINGTPVTLDQLAIKYPAIVLLDHSVETVKPEGGVVISTSLCTGTLIAYDIVLTAAHCVSKVSDPTKLLVRFGSTAFNPADEARIPAKSFIIHSSYSPENANRHINDIALIKMSRPLLPQFFKPAFLPMSVIDYAHSSSFTVIGYGTNVGKKTNPNGSGILREAKKDPALVSLYPDTVYVKHTDGTGVCYGDSGGPLFASYGGNQFVVGVASASATNLTQEQRQEAREKKLTLDQYLQLYPETVQCNSVSYYVSVKFHLDWIYNTMKILNAN